jgi:hypothetical protein
MLRAVRLESPDGTVSVLLTGLINKAAFPANSIVELYFRRWELNRTIATKRVSSASIRSTAQPKTASARSCLPS